jgi:hypothetical protein
MEEKHNRYEWNIEFFEMMMNFLDQKNITYSQLLSFLTVNFIGTLYNAGFTQEFADNTFDKMKQEFRKLKKKCDDEGLKNIFKILREEDACAK